MKTLLSFLTGVLIVGTMHAQSPKFHDAMVKTLAEFDTTQTADGLMTLANKFERIALAEKNQWLPYYYSGLARTFAVYIKNDAATTDEVLNVAEAHCTLADSLQPGNSEIFVLKSMIFGGRIMVDPMSRGQMYGMQSMAFMQQAMQLDPNNPRAYFIMGQSLFYTPPQYGGGKESACKVFGTSKEKFGVFSPASDIHPNWGEEQLDEIMKECVNPPLEEAPTED